MSALALLVHAQPDAIVAWRCGQAVTRARMLADIRHLARVLPRGGHLLNACTDRYRFAVGFAAGVLSGCTSLLPSTLTEPVIEYLRTVAADTVLLAEAGTVVPGALPRIDYPDDAAPEPDAGPVPLIEAGRCVARVFTSGSTGLPVPHDKSWGALHHNIRTGARQLGLEAGGCALLGTVPPQHMYGLESTVLLALLGGHALVAERPFYPADVAAALAALPAPRVLVTTPLHLRALLGTGQALAPLACLLSATAPLAHEMAVEAEAVYDTPLLEIYGSTESGQIATRRSARTPAWTLFPELRLDERNGRTTVAGGHVGADTLLGDRIERLPDGRFLLGPRDADQVNIAGKRASLQYLNALLGAIPGVEDGTFFLPEPLPGAPVTRLAALVVAAPSVRETLLTALARHLDPVFLPRPLLYVDALPRNATGKLPRAACLELLARHRSVT